MVDKSRVQIEVSLNSSLSLPVKGHSELEIIIKFFVSVDIILT